jgi:hypothetical protein
MKGWILMSTKGSDGAARERTSDIEAGDGLGAEQTRAGAARRRDRAAEDRDSEANVRDGLALAADSEAGSSALRQSREERQVRAARDRELAASDRVEASLDRVEAAVDRDKSTEALGDEVRAELAGTMGAQFGLAALQREMDRSERTGESLVVAFVGAVAGETPGNGPAQQVVEDVAECIENDVRDYDLVARMGDGGLICAQAGQSISRATVRYDEIALRLAARPSGARMTVELMELSSAESREAREQRPSAADAFSSWRRREDSQPTAAR